MAKFIKKLRYRYKYKDKNIEGTMAVDLGRFEGQFTRAQYLLDSQVMDDMVPFMPMQIGTFINVTRGMSASIAGSGKVVAAAPPFGRFLYKGKLMVDPETGSPYARKGVKKVLVSQYGGKSAADAGLTFSKHAHPNAQKEWFEPAKKRNKRKWLKITKRTAGGGKHG